MAAAANIEPEMLLRYVRGPAADLLHTYFHSGRYTGGSFERLAGGGDRSATEGTLRRMISSPYPSSGFGSRAEPRSRFLKCSRRRLLPISSKFRRGLTLWEAAEKVVGPRSPADRLWRLLVKVEGINWVTAGKLLARKRPHLIPVYDRVVKAALDRRTKDEWWRPLRAVLLSHPELIDRLQELHQNATLHRNVSLLRVLDVCIWMRAYGEPEPVPSAES